MIKWLRGLGRKLRRLVMKPVRVIEQTHDDYNEEGIEMISIIIGHKETDKGATNVGRYKNEYDYWTKVAYSLQCPDKTLRIVNRNGTNIRGAVKRADKYDPDLIIELHHNSYNGKANGGECLYATPSAKLAKKYCKFMSTALGNRNRGPKNVADYKRGRVNVNSAQNAASQALLIEPFFGDNPSDYVDSVLMANVLSKFLNDL